MNRDQLIAMKAQAQATILGLQAFISTLDLLMIQAPEPHDLECQHPADQIKTGGTFGNITKQCMRCGRLIEGTELVRPKVVGRTILLTGENNA